jgi:hypothetical protein
MPVCSAARSPRILLLRSGRHLSTALAALEAFAPGCEVAVIGTPGSERSIEQTGVPPERTFIYTLRSRFTPLAFLVSRTSIAARLWRFDHVAVLWNDPGGHGQGNVDRTALVLDPRGFLAITPDGRVIRRSWVPQIRRELQRAVASVMTAIALGALYAPALAMYLLHVILPARRQ